MHLTAPAQAGAVCIFWGCQSRGIGEGGSFPWRGQTDAEGWGWDEGRSGSQAGTGDF